MNQVVKQFFNSGLQVIVINKTSGHILKDHFLQVHEFSITYENRKTDLVEELTNQRQI